MTRRRITVGYGDPARGQERKLLREILVSRVPIPASGWVTQQTRTSNRRGAVGEARRAGGEPAPAGPKLGLQARNEA